MNGQGVAKSIDFALDYYKLAAIQGHKEALEQIQKLSEIGNEKAGYILMEI